MTRIGLLSDTHSHIDDRILYHLQKCDEIWHAGDIGDLKVTDQLADVAPVKAVYGNIDHATIRTEWPSDIVFQCEGKKVWMTHIGGRPPRYGAGILPRMQKIKPHIFVCGHSHILKVEMDKKMQSLYLNPGAAGYHGVHHMRTLLRFVIEGATIRDLEVVELGVRVKGLPE